MLTVLFGARLVAACAMLCGRVGLELTFRFRYELRDEFLGDRIWLRTNQVGLVVDLIALGALVALMRLLRSSAVGMAVRASLALGVVAWTAETLDLVNTRAYVVELNPVVTFWVVQIAGNLAAAVLVIALRMLRLLANSESGKETKRWSWGEKVAIGLLVIHPLLSLAVPLMPADVFRQVLLREAPTEVRVVSELVILILVLAARRGAASASRRAA